MPLFKSGSKKAFGKNVETEMEAGKPQKQSLAIAFSVQRKNKTKKKMALGGAVEGPAESKPYSRNPGTPAPKPDNEALLKEDYMAGDMDAPVGSTKPASTMITIPKSEYAALRSGGAYAKGGMVEGEEDTQEPSVPSPKKDNDGRSPHSYMSGEMPDQFAKGGMAKMRGSIHPKDLMDEDERAGSIADAIMEKRHRMAEGGMVDLEENSEERGRSPYDELNEAAGNEEQYDDSQISAQPTDSNEHGDDREDSEENQHDMVSRIRSKMKAKRG